MTSVAAFVPALACCGCQNSAGAEGTSAVRAEYDKDSGRLTRIAYDANGNGVHDTWAYMDGARLIRLEADGNENGRIDRWEYYPTSAASGGLRQPPDRIDRSTRDDGQVSRREFFENGAMARVEEDTDGNGATDKWETYRDGALSVLALDTTGNGKADRRLLYRPDGSLELIEADLTGSGRFQRMSQ